MFKKIKIKASIWRAHREHSSLFPGYDLNSNLLGIAVNIIETNIITSDTFNELKKLSTQYNAVAQACDELVLNIYFYRRWHAISRFYNIVPQALVERCGMRPGAVKGVILHFLGPKYKPWLKDSYFYKEWLDNLKRADSIDLNNRPAAKKKTCSTAGY